MGDVAVGFKHSRMDAYVLQSFLFTKLKFCLISEKFLNIMYAHGIKYLFVTSLEAVFI
jgi:hypothetical protein